MMTKTREQAEARFEFLSAADRALIEQCGKCRRFSVHECESEAGEIVGYVMRAPICRACNRRRQLRHRTAPKYAIAIR